MKIKWGCPIRGRGPRPKREEGPRVNSRVRAPKVRVVIDSGEMLGVMSSKEAYMEAEKRGLDLVEISPNANPPVCKIMDYGKFKYEQKKKAQSQKKQTGNVIKEITLSPVTQQHDLDFKVKNAIRFLEDGNRVKFTVRFKGRQMAHPELGLQQFEKITQALEEHGQIELQPKREGRFLAAVYAPLGGSKTKSKSGSKKAESSKEAKQN